MSISTLPGDLNFELQNTIDTQNNESVFRAALPYGAGTLALGGLGSYLAVTGFKATAGTAAAPTATAISGLALAVIGLYAFGAVAYTAIYAINNVEFKEQIDSVFSKIIDAAIFGRM